MTALTLLLLASFHQRIELASGPVHVWAPSSQTGGALTVLYVHGYFDSVDSAVEDHGLLPQFEASGLDATFVLPDGPRDGNEAVRFPDLEALLSSTERQLGRPLSRRLLVLGHSGAYRTVKTWLADPRVREVVLIDAVYGNPTPFERWVQGNPEARLILIAHSTRAKSNALATRNSARTIAAAEDLPTRGVALWPTAVGHMDIITRGKFLEPLLRVLGRFGHGEQPE